MIELRVLGRSARSQVFPLSALPISAGRNPAAALPLSGPGIWDLHFRIELHPTDGFVIHAEGDAFTAVDGKRVIRQKLRNGDLIECGDARLQFWLSPAPQREFRALEAFAWTLASCVMLAEVVAANYLAL